MAAEGSRPTPREKQRKLRQHNASAIFSVTRKHCSRHSISALHLPTATSSLGRVRRAGAHRGTTAASGQTRTARGLCPRTNPGSPPPEGLPPSTAHRRRVTSAGGLLLSLPAAGMPKLSKEAKQRLQQLFKGGQFAIRWGFIPVVLYLGFRRGADPGMPEPTIWRAVVRTIRIKNTASSVFGQHQINGSSCKVPKGRNSPMSLIWLVLRREIMPWSSLVNHHDGWYAKRWRELFLGTI
uniref:Mitochondrial import receptor subunit TOM7 homolog n=1 Tax=Pavo cristatus TaxID=9049 RepID=A0A8C9FJX5_PAVCR